MELNEHKSRAWRVYILQTHNTNFFEDSMGGLNPSNPPPSGYATDGSYRKQIAELPGADRQLINSVRC